MSHNSLSNYYEIIFNMNKYHNFATHAIENMFPFERDLYFDMIVSDMEKQQTEASKQKGVNYAFE